MGVKFKLGANLTAARKGCQLPERGTEKGSCKFGFITLSGDRADSGDGAGALKEAPMRGEPVGSRRIYRGVFHLFLLP